MLQLIGFHRLNLLRSTAGVSDHPSPSAVRAVVTW